MKQIHFGIEECMALEIQMTPSWPSRAIFITFAVLHIADRNLTNWSGSQVIATFEHYYL